jgi:hypothetical protein
VLFNTGCSRKAPQTSLATPEDVSRVLERVATLDGNANEGETK